jgi:hypothetical protein
MKKFYNAMQNKDYEKLQDVPAIMFALFPDNETNEWTTLNLDKEVDIPHAIAIMAYFEKVYLPKEVETKDTKCEWNPMMMLSNLHFENWANSILGTEGDRYYIEHFGVHAGIGMIYNQTAEPPHQQVTAMYAEVCMSSLKRLIECISNPQNCEPPMNVTQTPPNTSYVPDWAPWAKNISVVLYYPTTSGDIDNVTLEPDPWTFHGPGGCWVVWNPALDEGVHITDFTSGNYTVVVSVNGTEVLRKTFYRKIIVLTNATVEFSYPTQGMSLPNGTITVSWSEPKNVNIPKGVEVGYFLHIEGWNNSGGWDWWDSGATVGLIMGTSYEPPINLQAGWTYRFCVHPVFTDLETGEWLGDGREACVEATVPEEGSQTTQIQNATITLNGTIIIENESWNDLKNYNCTVAFVVDNRPSPEEITKQTIDLNACSSVNGTNNDGDSYTYHNCTYSITVNATEIKEKVQKWLPLNLYFYCDMNKDGNFTNWWDDAVFIGGDPYAGVWDNIWFDVRGNQLVVMRERNNGNIHEHKDYVVTGNISIHGPDIVVRNDWAGKETYLPLDILQIESESGSGASNENEQSINPGFPGEGEFQPSENYSGTSSVKTSY